MKKRMLCGLLSAMLLVCATPTAALADEEVPENTVTTDLILPNPQSEMTRGMAVIQLWELSGKPQVNYVLPFTDIVENTDTAEAIRWAASEGIANGYTETLFGTNDPVTREQLSAMIYRYVQKFGMGFQGSWMFHLACEDLDQVQEWAYEPMFWMVASKLIDGSADALLMPQSHVTVAEGAAIFEGLEQVAADKEVNFLDYGKTAE